MFVEYDFTAIRHLISSKRIFEEHISYIDMKISRISDKIPRTKSPSTQLPYNNNNDVILLGLTRTTKILYFSGPCLRHILYDNMAWWSISENISLTSYPL